MTTRFFDMSKTLWVLVPMVLLSACNTKNLKTAGASTNAMNLEADSASDKAALAILQTNCASCHRRSGGMGGISTITNAGSLVANGLFAPG